MAMPDVILCAICLPTMIFMVWRMIVDVWFTDWSDRDRMSSE
jgi:hypothetical protein